MSKETLFRLPEVYGHYKRKPLAIVIFEAFIHTIRVLRRTRPATGKLIVWWLWSNTSYVIHHLIKR